MNTAAGTAGLDALSPESLAASWAARPVRRFVPTPFSQALLAAPQRKVRTYEPMRKRFMIGRLIAAPTNFNGQA